MSGTPFSNVNNEDPNWLIVFHVFEKKMKNFININQTKLVDFLPLFV